MLKPFNDKLLVEVKSDPYGFEGESSSRRESGVVVGVPHEMIYLAFHSFAFENSIANDEVLRKVHKFYANLEGKTVVWESLKDSGRHFKDEDKEYVLLNMTDVIAYADADDTIELVDQVGSAGTFNLS